MKIDEIDLMAYLDDELSPGRKTEIEAELARSPDLRARLDRLKSADAVLRENIPIGARGSARPDTMALIAELAQKIEKTEATTSNNLVAFGPPEKITRPSPIRHFLPHAVAASVALFIGFTAATLLSGPQGPSSSPEFNQSYSMGLVDRHSLLYAALETKVSQQSVRLGDDDSVQATPLITFRTSDGTLCREFATTLRESSHHGIACRQMDGWSIRAVIAIPTPPKNAPDQFTTASDAGAGTIGEMIMKMMTGDAFNASDEQAAIKNGWKPQNR